jgi:hypothetical protein
MMDQWYNTTVNERGGGNVAQDFAKEYASLYAPSTVGAASKGQGVRASDVAKDVGLFAAGGVIGRGVGAGINAGLRAIPPGALSGGRKAIETSAAQQARANSIDKLLNETGPAAVEEFLRFPKTAYMPNLVSRATGKKNVDVFSQFFKNSDEFIPSGQEMYRIPSAGQVRKEMYSQSVPYPTTPGAEYLPGRIQSAAGSSDLNLLGMILAGKAPGTGGNQTYAPGIAKITAQENLPGIRNINDFISRYDIPDAAVSDFANEHLLSPHIRYVLRNYTPAQGSSFPTWYFDAFAR